MNWIYGFEKEGMQLRKDSFISKPTCYITLYSTLTPSYRLVTHARAAAYTKNNIMSAFEATGSGFLTHARFFFGSHEISLDLNLRQPLPLYSSVPPSGSPEL